MAQFSAERSALGNLRKHKWERSHSQLRKAMMKDSTNATTKYVTALYFFTPANPARNIDSAHYYQELAFSDFKKANVKQREKMKRFPLDSLILYKLYEQIDSAAFEQAKNNNTENAYLHYLKNFSRALYHAEAVELRDEVAYLDALKQNTFQGYYTFFQKYPTAQQVPEARRRYEKLLYETKTKDKRLKSYEAFLEDYPSTPFRREAEKNIFEISTASGSVSAYDNFIRKYPRSAFSKRAGDILFYVLQEGDHHELPSYLQSDSMQYIQKLDEGYLVPFLKDGRFGFMDREGKEVIQPTADAIDDNYICGNITEDILVIGDQILSRNGKVIFRGAITDLEDLGYGFLQMATDKGIVIMHKTGFIIPAQSVGDAHLSGGKFIAIKRNNRWALWTLTGRQLTDYSWEDIRNIGDVLILKKDNKYKLMRADDVGSLADQHPMKNQDFFDDVRPLQNGLIWARAGGFEGVLDGNLGAVLPFEKHSLTMIDCGIVATAANGSKIYDVKGNVTGVFDAIKCNMQWTAVRQTGYWRLYDLKNYRYLSSGMDSISFIGPFAVGHDSDSVTVFFPNEQFLRFTKTKTEFIPGKDSVSYLMINDGDKNNVYDGSGTKLFTVAYDKIVHITHGIFMVAKHEKKGLITQEGKIILPPEYDAIGGLTGQTVSVLKNMRFGLFDLSRRMMIKPQYDKNLVQYNSSTIVAYKEGHYGLIRWDGKPLSKFDFDEIVYWNDTAALVKRNFEWQLYDIAKQQTLMGGIRSFKTVSDSGNEKTLIIQQENNYGVMHSSRGVVIPSNFTLIKNVGSADVPMYFTEKHVEEAFIYVVIYYGRNGMLLRRQVYEEEDYEKIYCAP